jgi:alkaline phosphatase
MRILALITLLLPTVSCAQTRDAGSAEPRNVILFIADGCGFATFTMARDYADTVAGREPIFDGILTGSVVTRSSHQRVTDSAAAGTALACGVHTRNGQIATDTTGAPVGTVLEAAERAGYRTGLVTTTSITHATPAAFSAHVIDRALQDEIALQQLGQDIEVLLGGGMTHFLPAGGGGGRLDGRNLLEEAAAAGYSVVRDAEELEAADSLPLVGIFDPSHVDYEIDRDEGSEPSLAAMTRKAIDLLEDAPGGFFVMIEAGRIDHAAHGNDPAAHLHDLLAYDEAMRVALDFARRDGSTLVVATSDHETGGLTVGRDGIYAWHPEALVPVNRSLEVLREHLAARIEDMQDAEEVLAQVIALAEDSGMGPIDEAIGERLRETIRAGLASGASPAAIGDRVDDVLADLLSRRAGLGWTTSGHTAVDVPMYAEGPGSDLFRGTLTNAEFGRRLARALGVDLAQVTRDLKDPGAGN